MFLQELALGGRHNVYNSMAAAIAAKVMDIDNAAIRNGLSTFQAVEHRLEKVLSIGDVLPPDSDDFLSTTNLFNYQAKVIRQLAETESCVIVGRCADYILKDYDNVVRVFVHGPYDFCLEQAMRVNAKPENEMRKLMEKRDKYRGEYYKHYTGQNWYDARNYDLCLDSSKLGFEGCVEAIKAYMAVRGLSIEK